jgi:hypothetical protein
MAFNTGLSLLSHAGIANGGDDLFGSVGSFASKETIDAKVAANQVEFIDTSGASLCMVLPMLNVSGTETSGSTAPLLEIYGCIGFGEPSQDQYNREGKLFYQLATVTCSTVSSGTMAAASTQLVKESPTGVTFTHYTGAGTGTNEGQGPWIWSEILTGTLAQHADVALANGPFLVDVNVGFVNLVGISMFQELAFSFSIKDAPDATKASALTCLKY